MHANFYALLECVFVLFRVVGGSLCGSAHKTYAYAVAELPAYALQYNISADARFPRCCAFSKLRSGDLR